MRYPGMWSAKAWADETAEHNRMHPDAPVIQAWNDVPEVTQALDAYRLENATI